MDEYLEAYLRGDYFPLHMFDFGKSEEYDRAAWKILHGEDNSSHQSD